MRYFQNKNCIYTSAYFISFLAKTLKGKIKVIKEYKRSIYKSFGVIKYIQKVMGLRGHLSVTNKTTTFIEKTVVIA